ncbi:unnamed protein product [Eruca vesicaria subsp. sativa]|uniref:Dof zinc finger protein n=1 Tax=Eruca vesicaria subsp. sativa TaxID=29727 RepID=A0ABC8JZW6_ERUVS|nr:unnamed protein product [Eruca vesicaria subsp. sativa]
MENLNEERPPPRVCPRCSSDNTKFCFYNNYSVSQPRYNCRGCRRFWTHGGVLRDVPVGGKAHKTKPKRIDEPLFPQVVSVIQQVNNHQPFSHAQETNESLGTFGGSSSAVVGNRFSSLPETHGDMVPLTRSYPPMDRFGGSLNQGNYGAGFNDWVGNPLMNQPFCGHVYNYNNYLVNHEDPNNPNQSFNNTMNVNHNASTSGIRGYPSTDYMINNNKDRNKFMFGSSFHLEKRGP